MIEFYQYVSDTTFIASLGIGFTAQMVGSSLGMAYSITCSSILLAMGIPPAMTSATVHTSEVVNRLLSGLSHFRYGNVDAAIFKRLALFGTLGALCGAVLVTKVPVAMMRPLTAVVLLIMGLRVLFMGLLQLQIQLRKTPLAPLGFIGGFVDVIGGGGWGPVVTSTLLIRGNHPHVVVGSINFAKFFVAVAESAALIFFLKTPQWNIISGLIGGGMLAAPLAAYGCQKIPRRAAMFLVGTLVSGLSIRTLIKALA